MAKSDFSAAVNGAARNCRAEGRSNVGVDCRVLQNLCGNVANPSTESFAFCKDCGLCCIELIFRQDGFCSDFRGVFFNRVAVESYIVGVECNALDGDLDILVGVCDCVDTGFVGSYSGFLGICGFVVHLDCTCTLSVVLGERDLECEVLCFVVEIFNGVFQCVIEVFGREGCFESNFFHAFHRDNNGGRYASDCVVTISSRDGFAVCFNCKAFACFVAIVNYQHERVGFALHNGCFAADGVAFALGKSYVVGGFCNDAFNRDCGVFRYACDNVLAVCFGNSRSVCLNCEVRAFFVVAIDCYDEFVAIALFDCSLAACDGVANSFCGQRYDDVFDDFFNAFDGDCEVLCDIFNNVLAILFFNGRSVSFHCEACALLVACDNFNGELVGFTFHYCCFAADRIRFGIFRQSYVVDGFSRDAFNCDCDVFRYACDNIAAFSCRDGCAVCLDNQRFENFVFVGNFKCERVAFALHDGCHAIERATCNGWERYVVDGFSRDAFNCDCDIFGYVFDNILAVNFFNCSSVCFDCKVLGLFVCIVDCECELVVVAFQHRLFADNRVAFALGKRDCTISGFFVDAFNCDCEFCRDVFNNVLAVCFFNGRSVCFHCEVIALFKAGGNCNGEFVVFAHCHFGIAADSVADGALRKIYVDSLFDNAFNRNCEVSEHVFNNILAVCFGDSRSVCFHCKICTLFVDIADCDGERVAFAFHDGRFAANGVANGACRQSYCVDRFCNNAFNRDCGVCSDAFDNVLAVLFFNSRSVCFDCKVCGLFVGAIDCYGEFVACALFDCGLAACYGVANSFCGQRYGDVFDDFFNAAHFDGEVFRYVCNDVLAVSSADRLAVNFHCEFVCGFVPVGNGNGKFVACALFHRRCTADRVADRGFGESYGERFRSGNILDNALYGNDEILADVLDNEFSVRFGDCRPIDGDTEFVALFESGGNGYREFVAFAFHSGFQTANRVACLHRGHLHVDCFDVACGEREKHCQYTNNS